MNSKGVAYTWVCVFLVILITPFMWYILDASAEALINRVTDMYSDEFTDTRYSALNTFFIAIWRYMPIFILVGLLIWAIMRTLKEKRVAGYYQY